MSRLGLPPDMAGGHPEGLPELFIDRSLGRRQVPDLLRSEGLRLRTLAEVYGIPQDETIADVEWLARCGREGWAVLMKDDRIPSVTLLPTLGTIGWGADCAR